MSCNVPPLCPECYRTQDDAIRAFHGALIETLRAGESLWDPWELETNFGALDAADANAPIPSADNDVDDAELDDSDEEEDGGVPLPTNANDSVLVNGLYGSNSVFHENDPTSMNGSNETSVPDEDLTRSTAPSPSLGEPSGAPPFEADNDMANDSDPGSASNSLQDDEAEQDEQQASQARAFLAHFWLKRFTALARVNLQHKWLDEPRETWTVEDEQRVRDGVLANFREEMGVFGDG